MPEEKKSNTTLISGIIILVLAVVSFGTYKYIKKDEITTLDNTITPPSTLPVTPPVAVSTVFKNGTYNSKGTYISPGGTENIDVTVVLKDDVITGVTVKSLAVNPTSKIMQGKFISGIEAAVVGKKLTDVVLTHISGSSLTPKGWNDAVAKIQIQAKA